MHMLSTGIAKGKINELLALAIKGLLQPVFQSRLRFSFPLLTARKDPYSWLSLHQLSRLPSWF